ncbi:MAG: O-antigen ligase family protein [Acidobacteria bacterium]|nr:O-antigen ligase family protein [Acidobacteriota bacterium]
MLLIVVAAGWLSAPVIGFLNALTFLTAVGFLVLLAGFRRPAFGVAGAALVCTLDPLTRHFLSNAVLRWNTLNFMLIGISVLAGAFVWRLSDVHSRLLKLLIVLLAADLVFSPDVAGGVQHLLGIIAMFGLVVYFAQAGDDPDIWYTVGLVCGTAGALGGLMYFSLQDGLPFMNHNAYALFPEAAVFGACLGFHHAADRRYGQLILGLLVTTNVVWAFLSGSRGGALIAATGLLFVLFSMRRQTDRAVVAGAAVGITCIALIAFATLGDYTLRRFSKLLDEEQTASGRTSGRSDLVIAGLHMFSEHPLGVGTGGFAATWAQVGFLPGLSTFKRGEEFPAHAGWIKILAENGWPGMILLVGYVGSFALRGLTRRSPGSVSLGLLVTAGLAVSLTTTEFQGKTIWLLAAAGTARLSSAEMARALGAEARRFGIVQRRLVTRHSRRVTSSVTG